MSGRKIFLRETHPRAPSENLAVNELCSGIIGRGDLDFIARIYTHTNGVILGNTQSIFDIRTNACHAQGYEVVRRPTGGSAIIVDKEATLCYSLFYKVPPSRLNLTREYESITIPLAQNLGPGFSVEGTYYLRYKKDEHGYPIAGHAMRSKKGVLQFDGVINLTQLDVQLVSQLLKLRELYKSGEESRIIMDGTVYDLRGRKSYPLEKSSLVMSEEEELGKMSGLGELGYSKQDFIGAFYKTITALFGEVQAGDSYDFPQSSIMLAQEQLKKELNKGRRICLGHCFIDMLEPEPKIHYGGYCK